MSGRAFYLLVSRTNPPRRHHSPRAGYGYPGLAPVLGSSDRAASYCVRLSRPTGRCLFPSSFHHLFEEGL